MFINVGQFKVKFSNSEMCKSALTLFSRADFVSFVAGYDETSSPVMSALKRLSARSMSSSKSLENLTLQTSSPTLSYSHSVQLYYS